MPTLSNNPLEDRIAEAVRRECAPPYQDDLMRCVPLFAAVVVQMPDISQQWLLRTVRVIAIEHCYVVDGGDWPADEFAGLERATRRIAAHLHRYRRESRLDHAGGDDHGSNMYG